VRPLYEGHFPTSFGKRTRQWSAGLTGTYHDCVGMLSSHDFSFLV
jgi:hypothetical protein